MDTVYIIILYKGNGFFERNGRNGRTGEIGIIRIILG